MSASNSVGQQVGHADGQRQMAVAPSIANMDGLSNGFSCGSLSQAAQPRSHPTGPSQKQHDLSRSSGASHMKSNVVGHLGAHQYDIFKGRGLPNLDYQAGGNIQFQD